MSEIATLAKAALMIIDVQYAIDAPYHSAVGPRNNPDAEDRIVELLAAWRDAGLPTIHVRHVSTSATSAYRPGQLGNDFKHQIAPWPSEWVLAKTTNSAFIGTGLEAQLRDRSISTLVVTGVATNNSVEATVRMAGNLGFEAYVVADACFAFARYDHGGRLRTAEEVHDMSLANLDGEYCSIVTSEDLLAKLQADGRPQ